MTRGLVSLLKAEFILERWLALNGVHLPGLSICLIIRKKSVS